jgi:hypothetical protein
MLCLCDEGSINEPGKTVYEIVNYWKTVRPENSHALAVRPSTRGNKGQSLRWRNYLFCEAHCSVSRLVTPFSCASTLSVPRFL